MTLTDVTENGLCVEEVKVNGSTTNQTGFSRCIITINLWILYAVSRQRVFGAGKLECGISIADAERPVA